MVGWRFDYSVYHSLSPRDAMLHIIISQATYVDHSMILPRSPSVCVLGCVWYLLHLLELYQTSQNPTHELKGSAPGRQELNFRLMSI